MKLVKAIVREDKVNEIADALERIGAPEFTADERYAVSTRWRDVA